MSAPVPACRIKKKAIERTIVFSWDSWGLLEKIMAVDHTVHRLAVLGTDADTLRNILHRRLPDVLGTFAFMPCLRGLLSFPQLAGSLFRPVITSKALIGHLPRGLLPLRDIFAVDGIDVGLQTFLRLPTEK